jgi:hypothetical protein
MPRLIAAWLAISLGCGTADAGYLVSGVPYSFQDISGTGTSTLAFTDDSTASVNPATPFTFYGTSYSTIFYSTNGLISFGSPNSSFSNTDLSSSGSTSGLPTIAAFWDDLETFSSGGGSVFFQAFADRTVLQWNNVHHYYSSSGLATFEAVLYANGNIQMNYQSLAFFDGNDNGASATIGVRNSDGQYTEWSYNTASVSAGTSLLFTNGPVATPAPPTLVLALAALPALGLLRPRRRAA